MSNIQLYFTYEDLVIIKETLQFAIDTMQESINKGFQLDKKGISVFTSTKELLYRVDEAVRKLDRMADNGEFDRGDTLPPTLN